MSCGYFPGGLVGPVKALAQAFTLPAISVPHWARITFEIASDRAQWGTEIAGLGQSLDRPDKPARKISAAHERAWLRDRAWTARDLGQINGLFRRCVRLQVSVDDEFEQEHPVRLGRSMMSHAAFWHC